MADEDDTATSIEISLQKLQTTLTILTYFRDAPAEVRADDLTSFIWCCGDRGLRQLRELKIQLHSLGLVYISTSDRERHDSSVG